MSRRKTRPQASAPRSVAPAAFATPTACPCGLPADYTDCCGRLHRGDAAATTAEQLMRSRYSAFVVGDAAYLLASWHPETRPAALDLDPRTRWLGLEILGAEDGGPFHAEGAVAFRARYREGGREHVLDERSRFSRVDGRWVYVDGRFAD
ncbi:YchJ family protein [Uniformispora flossi]|uniref:YchJ family protein n=1 Tax=Uniformispora flossi TaxID=3390723 RepID=UPI003C3077C0